MRRTYKRKGTCWDQGPGADRDILSPVKVMPALRGDDTARQVINAGIGGQGDARPGVAVQGQYRHIASGIDPGVSRSWARKKQNKVCDAWFMPQFRSARRRLEALLTRHCFVRRAPCISPPHCGSCTRDGRSDRRWGGIRWGKPPSWPLWRRDFGTEVRLAASEWTH